MFLMTKCVMSVKGHAVAGSLPHSSVPMSPASSIIASIVGLRYTPGLVGNSTSHS